MPPENSSPIFFKIVASIILVLGLLFISFDVIPMFKGIVEIGHLTSNTLLGLNLIIQSLLVWNGKIPQKIEQA